MHSEFMYVEEEMKHLRALIRETVMQRDRIRTAMENWYDSQPGKQFPQINDLLLLDDRLSRLDSQFKQLWDGRHGLTRQG